MFAVAKRSVVRHYAPFRPAFVTLHAQVSHLQRCFSAVQGGAVVQPAKEGAQRWSIRTGILAGTVAASAIAILDEGFRRCAEFWIVVLPIYGHYLYVDKVSHPTKIGDSSVTLGAADGDVAARQAAFERLHSRYSPVVERATLRLRGFYLKCAQMMSMREDFLPKQYLQWTRKLQDEAPVTLSSAEARACVAQELGLPEGDASLSEVFSDWSAEPIGCASIGQVYSATLRSTGEKVAVKVQSPGIEGLFRADIKTLKFFTAFALPWAVQNMNAIERMFETEFDYDLERQNLEAVHNIVMACWAPQVQVPRPVPELCTRRVLCMTYLDGEKLVDGVRGRMRNVAEREGRDPEAYEAEQLQALRTGKRQAQSARAARWQTAVWRWWQRFRFGAAAGEDVLDLPSMMETLMAVHGQQIFAHGVFNADPHPGNILLLRDGRTLGLIDFGQVQRIPLDFRLRLAHLIIALARRDAQEVMKLEQELGIRTARSRPDVRFRMCSFWLDRDTNDVMQGMNLHDFMAWGEREDPMLEFPEDLYLVCRCSVMLRSLSLAFGVRLSTAEYWRPHAEALLRKYSGRE
mmetsp:Transcript_104582/g.207665  ORF Transcript_104582/g.207665 Transcript_104582/m.207665 type:complete len:575 (-) Transcript_104582:139-1863(-)|eukprot:CAMPEP_0172807526 /NCGR_PEP_ID=MMETSP1075-20121228/7062_1 /TAXON_ID=2916 /ORGANISM="Ceratium fusus, Strain PA161109" /LENGTH=574 /DNA_ID=CAMNT_0013646525 /DNA_START=49 /DNA_END=1773 /DNA_ORIENTATION=+